MAENGQLKFRRVLLKLSGEGLLGNQQYGIDPETVDRIASEIKAVHDMGAEVCMVIGGGTSSAASKVPPRAWNAQLPTIWACSPPS